MEMKNCKFTSFFRRFAFDFEATLCGLGRYFYEASGGLFIKILN
jgi:hypothetical protein